ncbi:MAG: potassium channel family protein [Candidatus Limnocylindrales bacterium]
MSGLPGQPVTSRRRHPVPARFGRSHIRVWLAAVVTVVALGTLGYVLIERWSLLDALYMTVITITTVGFREVGPLGPVGRVWTMLVAVVGVGLLFGFVGVVAESLVFEATSGEREARRMLRAVEGLRGHVVLCGYGRVGSTVARELRHDGEDVVVIDVLPESLERARGEGFLAVEGDATKDATLRAAGIERARGLVATVDADADNVYVILSARAMNPGLFVVARANAADAEAKLTRAGANRVVSPYIMAGRRIAGLAMRPRVVDFIDAALSHGELAFSLEELTAREGDSITGSSVGELRDRGIFTLAIVRPEGGYAANPGPERRLAAGETLIVSGSAATLAALLEADHAP